MNVALVRCFCILLLYNCICVTGKSQGTIQKNEGHFLAALDFVPSSGIYQQRKNRILNPSQHQGFPNEYRENSISVSGMVKGAVLTMDWWTLFGEPVENYNFQWTTTGRYSVYKEGGKGYTVERNELAKYPDLLLRFNAIKPLDIKFVIYWKHTGDAYKRMHFTFSSSNRQHSVKTVIDEGLLTEPSGKSPLSVPGIRQGKGENFISTKFDNYQHYSLTTEHKQSWLDEFNKANTIFIEHFNVTAIRWPVSEMLAIATLFEEYEKGEKKPSPMEEVQSGVAAIQSTAPYNRNDFWGEPFEETRVNITLNLENKVWVVRNNGNVTYTDKNNTITQFSGTNTSKNKILILERPPLPGKSKYGVTNRVSLIDYRGSLLSFDGKTEFYQISSYKNYEGYYEIHHLKQWTYIKDVCYTAGSGGLALGKIRFNKSFEEARNNLLQHKDKEELCTQFGVKWSPYGISEFIIYYLNDSMQLVKKETEYHLDSNFDYIK